MSTSRPETIGGETPVAGNWHGLATRILHGHRLTVDEGREVLRCPDDGLLDLLAAAFRVRRQFFGTTVQLYFLINAKSGLCPEDCAYCSQSKRATSDIPKYNLLHRDALLEDAAAAQQRGAKTYCIVKAVGNFCS